MIGAQLDRVVGLLQGARAGADRYAAQPNADTHAVPAKTSLFSTATTFPAFPVLSSSSSYIVID